MAAMTVCKVQRGQEVRLMTPGQFNAERQTRQQMEQSCTADTAWRLRREDGRNDQCWRNTEVRLLLLYMSKFFSYFELSPAAGRV